MSELSCQALEMNLPVMGMGLTELNRSVEEKSELNCRAVGKTKPNHSVGEMSKQNCREVEMNPPMLEMGLTELNPSVGEMIKLNYSAVNN